MNNALMPLYIMVADYVTQLALWIQSNPEIAAGIAAVTGGLVALSGIITLLTPIFRVLLPVFRLLGVAARIVAVSYCRNICTSLGNHCSYRRIDCHRIFNY